MKLLARSRAKVTVNQSIQRPIEPGAALSPAAVRRGLRLSIIEGALSNIHITVCAGAFLTGELADLNASRDAFVAAISEVAKSPLQASRRPERLRR